MRHILHRGQRVRGNQNVLSSTGRRAPFTVTQPSHRPNAVKNRRSKLRFQDRGILRRPLHYAVQLLRNDVTPLGALIPGAGIEAHRKIILRLQERVRELLACRMNDARTFQEVDVCLDFVVASLLFAVRRVTVKGSVNASAIARTRLFSL